MFDIEINLGGPIKTQRSVSFKLFQLPDSASFHFVDIHDHRPL